MADSYRKDIINILAVCTGNICRSPMTEGILRKIFEDNTLIKIASAGTHALEGNPATEFAIISAIENGIDIADHKARGLNPEIIHASNIILCMEPSHIEYVLSLDTSAYGRVFNLAVFSDRGKLRKIPDPYGSSLREYRECFKVINMCLCNFIGKLPAI